MRREGNSKPVFWMAARTRSRASLTSVSGRPTRVNDGRPFARCASTCTSGAASPSSARLIRVATAKGFCLVLVRLVARFQFLESRFHLGELLARAQEYFGLDIEFLARDEVELGKPARQAGLEVLFEIAGRGLLEHFAEFCASWSRFKVGVRMGVLTRSLVAESVAEAAAGFGRGGYAPILCGVA